MPVISAGVLNKTGKTILSRQFIEISKARIEGLLTAFPKMLNSESQHTFIETDQVRYLYQPLENLYVVIVTNKSSNILEDLETLHLVAKIIPEYAYPNGVATHEGNSIESEIAKHAFEIIFALDETISMGYKERVNIQQIRHFTSMISHDEERFKDQERMKILQAKKEMEERRLRIEREKKLERSMQSSSYTARPTPSISPSMPMSTASATSPRFTSSSNRPVKGLKLGSKSSNTGNAAKVLEEMNVKEVEVPRTHNTEHTGHSEQQSNKTLVKSDNKFEILISEKLVISADNDGGVQSMEIRGELRATANDEACTEAQIFLSQGSVPDLQINTHPSMNRDLFQKSSVLAKKEGSAYSLMSQAQVLKWRIMSKDEKMLPLAVTLWPEDRGTETIVPIEFSKKCPFDLHDVIISVPVRDPPKVGEGIGSADYNPKQSSLDWHIPLIDSKMNFGSIEFKVPRVPPKSFFPVSISFRAEETFFPLQVIQVSDPKENPIEPHVTISLEVEQFYVE